MEKHTVSAGRGLRWIAAGFELFRRQPSVWLIIIVILLVLDALVSRIPVLGMLIVALLQPILTAGLVGGCRDVEEGRKLTARQLLAGFAYKTHDLLIVGAVILTANVVIGLLTGGLMKFGGLGGGLLGYGASLLVAALVLPLMMATLFAIPLIWFQQRPAVDAMRLSFDASMTNFAAFIGFVFTSLILTAVAAIPFGLGLLVSGPTLIGAVYYAYKDLLE